MMLAPTFFNPQRFDLLILPGGRWELLPAPGSQEDVRRGATCPVCRCEIARNHTTGEWDLVESSSSSGRSVGEVVPAPAADIVLHDLVGPARRSQSEDTEQYQQQMSAFLGTVRSAAPAGRRPSLSSSPDVINIAGSTTRTAPTTPTRTSTQRTVPARAAHSHSHDEEPLRLYDEEVVPFYHSDGSVEPMVRWSDGSSVPLADWLEARPTRRTGRDVVGRDAGQRVGTSSAGRAQQSADHQTAQQPTDHHVGGRGPAEEVGGRGQIVGGFAGGEQPRSPMDLEPPPLGASAGVSSVGIDATPASTPLAGSSRTPPAGDHRPAAGAGGMLNEIAPAGAVVIDNTPAPVGGLGAESRWECPCPLTQWRELLRAHGLLL